MLRGGASFREGLLCSERQGNMDGPMPQHQCFREMTGMTEVFFSFFFFLFPLSPLVDILDHKGTPGTQISAFQREPEFDGPTRVLSAARHSSASKKESSGKELLHLTKPQHHYSFPHSCLHVFTNLSVQNKCQFHI